MKKVIAIFTLVVLTFSCSKEEMTTDNASMSKSSNSQSNWNDYAISVSVSEEGSLWTYTITRANNKAKDLSHFIIDLNNCGLESASFGNIVWATVNGSPADLKQTEGSGTNCNPQSVTSNFVKFDNLSSSSSWILVLKFDRGYDVDSSSTGWIKAGNSCNSGVIPGPGCPLGNYCSYSQGFFFSTGSFMNGASSYWENGLTVGGVTYTQQQGTMIWENDRGPGGDQTLNGFFQLGAVRLSGVESQVANQVLIIETYFNGLNILSTATTGTNGNNTYTYYNLPATSNGINKNQVIAAGGAIGSYIDSNHCQEIN